MGTRVTIEVHTTFFLDQGSSRQELKTVINPRTDIFKKK